MGAGEGEGLDRAVRTLKGVGIFRPARRTDRENLRVGGKRVTK